jgi:CHAD domain-containing protein
LLGKEIDDQQRDRFKSLAGAAGKTRDWDILSELLVETLGARQAPTDRLRAARAAALEDSRETLSHAGIHAVLRDALADASGALWHQTGERTPLKKFARKRVAAAEKSLNKRMHHAAYAKRSDYASYHDVRKAGKKVRYLLEFFEPLLTKKQLNTLKGLKKLQKRFGTLNDVVASEELLRGNREIFSNNRDVKVAFAALEKQRKRQVRAASKLL